MNKSLIIGLLALVLYPLYSLTPYIGYIPYIDLIQDGQKYELQYFSNGCFQGLTQKIGIRKKNNEYILEFEKTKKILSQDDLSVIRTFEEDLHYREFDEGCTTKDQYLVVFKNDTITNTWDGSCTWNGWKNLLAKLSIQNP